MDNFFRVEVISQTPNPQQVIYAALHQDYSDTFVYDERDHFPSEEECGEIIIKRLLAGGRGHYGPMEHPQIVFNCGYFPHSVMQQARTHRVGVSFDCQSFRYTGKGIARLGLELKLALSKYQNLTDCLQNSPELKDHLERTIYLRPVGKYRDRQGKSYKYAEDDLLDDLVECARLVINYSNKLESGLSEEHARGLLPFDYRQHFVVSFNVRSLMHFLDMRAPANAQLEIQQMCKLILPHFLRWTPAIASWYLSHRYTRAKLAP
ncbi:thymidylate synthase (FAD) [Chlorogloeopsis fritschii PCC 6912]|uniref:FAD-dependent thymidylate synthase n=1 Tax=Chlorogloeopsis fritschii PCC 6912 TaxID=211165 RepID=A0A3S0XKQ4_CHLFR|nr:FAD-dependent thymidylate synthase [Chlorogloeopsis fritschii]RUR74896.1 thymidylate synthase (FAD) [Chlorogloeopsis fritschii PCC 6912]